MEEIATAPGLTWNVEGMVGLAGPLAELLERLDAAFVDLAAGFGAEKHCYSPLLAVRDLKRVDYFASFFHLATLPVRVVPQEAAAFRDANADLAGGSLVVGRIAPVEAVLSPTACYSVYASLAGTDLGDRPRHVTTCGTCFRQESSYEPLRRQWSFRMREVVHLGSESTARQFLETARRATVDLATRWGVGLAVEEATDPFFEPGLPRDQYEKRFPSKRDMTTQDGLAIGSLNLHGSFFGDAFGLTFAGRPAHSACVAFGLERWVYAILRAHGTDPAGWPP